MEIVTQEKRPSASFGCALFLSSSIEILWDTFQTPAVSAGPSSYTHHWSGGAFCNAFIVRFGY